LPSPGDLRLLRVSLPLRVDSSELSARRAVNSAYEPNTSLASSRAIAVLPPESLPRKSRQVVVAGNGLDVFFLTVLLVMPDRHRSTVLDMPGTMSPCPG
jgi:hypothetical protein